MRARLSATTLAAAFALSACATSGELAPTEQEEALAADLESRSIVPATEAEREAIGNQDLLTQAAFWAEAHQLNPGDLEAAVQLSTVLRKLGNTERAREVARQGLALYPDDADLLASYGMALTALGQGQQAIEPLSRALNERGEDWRLVNALGVALEQAGRSEAARARFNQARGLAPGEPAILSNLALSHALAGEPEEAERLLRTAADSDRATPQVRQNLALVLALQGRFDEAEEMALVDTTPEMAEANLDYVRSMLSTPRRWDALAEGAESEQP
jgi:Flp pilus assembly protein TadD